MLLPQDFLNRIWILRKVLHPMNPLDAMEFLLDKVSHTKTNAEFVKGMSG